MTAQIHEKLIYQDQTHRLASEPLEPYLKKNNLEDKFEGTCSACWRGYIGTWEIKNYRLYLIDLKLEHCWEKPHGLVGVEYIFPNQKEVFADWFSDTIQIQEGKMLEYEHLGFSSTYEFDLFLKFEKGVLVSSTEVDNRNKAGLN
jgi:hypothetical protein